MARPRQGPGGSGLTGKGLEGWSMGQVELFTCAIQLDGASPLLLGATMLAYFVS